MRRLILSFGLFALSAWGQGRGGQGTIPLVSLKTIAIPEVPNLSDYVQDRTALIVLGKALFWDVQAGSDGRTACATCHFHAGGDHRSQNQLASPASLTVETHSMTESCQP